jgi:hypothetical protein
LARYPRAGHPARRRGPDPRPYPEVPTRSPYPEVPIRSRPFEPVRRDPPEERPCACV